MQAGGEIATLGEAEEGSSHTNMVKHGYNLRAIFSLCSDTLSVPGEFPRLKARGSRLEMSPSSGQQNKILVNFQL